MSGALAGIISVASGLDIYFRSCIYHCICRRCDLATLCGMAERRGIDDAVGAVTVHGTIGLFGLIMLGVFASGYPALDIENPPTISLIGQIVGAIVFFLLGFVPGYVVSLILKGLGMLRTLRAEIAGLDLSGFLRKPIPKAFPLNPHQVNIV